MLRAPIPSPPYAGGCLCGRVRYLLRARPLAINACHCADCKKVSGTTHAVHLHADRATFELAGETHTYVRRGDSGRELEMVRCAACGVRLLQTPCASPSLLLIAAGTLDEPSWVVPTSHIWAERAAPDFPFEKDALVLRGQPADRRQLWNHFQLLYPEQGPDPSGAQAHW